MTIIQITAKPFFIIIAFVMADLTFGLSRTGKAIIVSHTERDKAMRIISARLMTKQERKIYEEG